MPKAKYKKRKDGRYCTKIDYGRDEETGKRRYVMLYGKTTQELELKKAQILSDVDRKIFVEPNRVTFGEYSKYWLKQKRLVVEMHTYNMYRSVLNNHLSDLNDIVIKEIAKHDMQEIINSKIDSPRISQQIKITLNQVLEAAIEDNLVFRNYSKRLILPKCKRTEKRCLTSAEDVLSDITDFDDRELAYIKIIKYCGLRRGEALALTKQDIDLKNNLININKAVVFDNNKPIIKAPKTHAGYRSVPMPQMCRNFIEYYVKSTETDYLFYNTHDKALITEQGFRILWLSIIAKMDAKADELDYGKIDGLTSHVFRHNYATTLYYADVRVKEAQKLLGHSSISVTMDIYTHLEDNNDLTTSKLNIFLENKQNPL